MMRKSLVKLGMFCMAILSSCESIFIPERVSDDNLAVFEQAWQFADENYSFFEYKRINWDSAKAVFRPRAEMASSNEELFEVLSDMLYLLRDGHVNLSTPFNVSRNWDWYLNAPPNYYYHILERNYFKDQQQYVGPFEVMYFDSLDICYIYYGAFTSLFSEQDLNYIIDTYKPQAKGFILDIRNNGGGLVNNAERLASRANKSEGAVLAFEQSKSGPDHEDFGDIEEISISSSSNGLFPENTVLLTNRQSYSASNMCAAFFRSMGKTIIGDSTGGGGGLPVSTELSNGWVLRVSGTRFFGTDMLNVENGVPPSIKVDITDEDLENGRDAILERAFEHLNSGS